MKSARGTIGLPVKVSMKVPPKRKGNVRTSPEAHRLLHGLNESPSQKEGKSRPRYLLYAKKPASMKVPPKRKGNRGYGRGARHA